MNEKKRSRTPLIIGGVVVVSVLGLCCCSGFGVYLLGKQNREAEEANFAGLDAACRGEAVPGTAPVVADGTIHVRIYDDEGDMLNHWLPREMWSTALADTEAVVCQVSSRERYDLERCDYETGLVTGFTGGQNVILRRGYRQRYRVVAAQTGQTLFEQLVEGDPPDPCPASGEFDTGGETDSLHGDIVRGENVGEWLRTLQL